MASPRPGKPAARLWYGSLFFGRGLCLYFGWINEEISIGIPVLAVSETELDFGTSTTQLTFDIANTGEGELDWTITSSLPSKVTVDPASGDTIDETDTITVTVNRSGVAPGTYNPTISIVSDGGNASIELTVVVE